MVVILYKCLKNQLTEKEGTMDINLFKSKMALFGDNGKTLSKEMGISEVAFSAKKNEKHGAGFTQGEILFIKNRYNLTPVEVDTIFFTQKVS
jgi:hypothetical protein